MQGSKKKEKKRPINFKTFKLISSEKIRYWVHETTVSSFKRSNEETKERLEFKNYKRWTLKFGRRVGRWHWIISQEVKQENKMRRKMPKLKGSIKRAHSFSRKRKKWRKFWKKVFKKFPRTEGPLLDRKGPLSAQQNGVGIGRRSQWDISQGNPQALGAKRWFTPSREKAHQSHLKVRKQDSTRFFNSRVGSLKTAEGIPRNGWSPSSWSQRWHSTHPPRFHMPPLRPMLGLEPKWANGWDGDLIREQVSRLTCYISGDKKQARKAHTITSPY